MFLIFNCTEFRIKCKYFVLKSHVCCREQCNILKSKRKIIYIQ